MNRAGLAEFLRSRRARVTPGDVALPDTGQRRTPGLRRQEVAQLAGMSIDYYIRLEQGRGPHPSRQVINALAQALMLDQDERTHLFRLAGQPLNAPGIRSDVPESALHLIDSLEEVPAFVLNPRYDILAWNPLAYALLDLGSRSHDDLNVIRWTFLSPDIDELLDDEQQGHFARACVANLRMAVGCYPDDPGLRALVAEMLALSPAFARVWDAHEVRPREERLTHVAHPATGTIETLCQVMRVPGRDDLQVVICTTEPGSPSEQALRELRRLTLSS
ncbi:helix-turn-helix transcriptional regulator [Nonomuraea glycinis]|uniref:Transcriptional regulator n=1 Tax=Nonomuraea glycinis TaxID=2047744 RepID=A0A918E8M4_9ACTN|nr:helix-turn-helix transcriptional regulator [Nonomuraea glycinis]MCA2179658.1 helix-turn-helix transcriptional regulator [Nonomuraea glycinis]GGP15219.1 transcriptional regulator [Nonomuraea glycinis]